MEGQKTIEIRQRAFEFGLSYVEYIPKDPENHKEYLILIRSGGSKGGRIGNAPPPPPSADWFFFFTPEVGLVGERYP